MITALGIPPRIPINQVQEDTVVEMVRKYLRLAMAEGRTGNLSWQVRLDKGSVRDKYVSGEFQER